MKWFHGGLWGGGGGYHIYIYNIYINGYEGMLWGISAPV